MVFLLSPNPPIGDDAARLRGPRLRGVSAGKGGPRNARRLPLILGHGTLSGTGMVRR